MKPATPGGRGKTSLYARPHVKTNRKGCPFTALSYKDFITAKKSSGLIIVGISRHVKNPEPRVSLREYYEDVPCRAASIAD
jgi:hypothetical protein